MKSTEQPTLPFVDRPTVGRFLRIAIVGISFALLNGFDVQRVTAQTPWEITPYHCRVWMAASFHPSLSPAFEAKLREQIVNVLRARHGATWEVDVLDAPLNVKRCVQRLVPQDWASIPWADVDQTPPAVELDKLFIVQIVPQPQHLELHIAEFDIATRQLGTRLLKTCVASDGLAWCIADTITDAFTPTAMVHRVENQQAELRVRAGELLTDRNEPAAIAQGALLQAVAIPFTPHGKVRTESIRVIPWTVLEVVESLPGRLQATIHSGYGQPLRTRRSRRLQQRATVLKVRHPHTTIQITGNRASARPLQGYEILVEGRGEPPGEVVGVSDRRGQVQILASDLPLQQIILRHGTKILSRLPLVVGYRDFAPLPLTDDNDRLELEGYVQGVMDRLIDVVAQRQLITTRVRKLIEAGNYDRARELIAQLRKVESRSEFLDRIQRRQRMLSGDNREMQSRAVDKLFADTRALFEQYLDPLLPQRLQDELTQRETSGAPLPSLP